MGSKPVVDEAAARQLLPHSWHAFFGRFGRLTPTQRRALEPVADGRSVLLCAPTASGKTEAIIAPLVERLLAARVDRRTRGARGAPGRGDGRGVRILIVSPTRALCNDLARRLGPPLQACGLSLDRKTGDSPSLSTRRLPEVLVTTPESLDSMLSRRPAMLSDVVACLIDEVHLIDRTARGDHLRALLCRLDHVADDLQRCGASATVADAGRLARDFLGAEAVVVDASDAEARQLDVTFCRTPVDAIAEAVRAEPPEKVLVFCNARRDVEQLGGALERELGPDTVFLHHGSLAKETRLRAERGFLERRQAVCVATMTLELGIDIGDIGRVVLYGCPPDAASFVQRVGRGNRRGDRVAVTCLPLDDFDKRRLEHLVECAQHGRLFADPVAFRPAVIAQQAVSLCFQNPKGWVSAAALRARLPADVRRLYAQADVAPILAALQDEGWLYADAHGRYVADELAVERYERGLIHTHITPDSEVALVERTTGRLLGTARPSAAALAEPDASVLLAGRRRQLVGERDGRLVVDTVDGDDDPQFASRSGPRYSFALARDLARFLGIATDTIPATPVGDRRWRLDHFLGTIWGDLLAWILRSRGARVRGDAFHLEVSCGARPPALGDADQLADAAGAALDDESWRRRATRAFGAGPWHADYVPDDLARRWLEASVRPQAFAETLARFRIVEA